MLLKASVFGLQNTSVSFSNFFLFPMKLHYSVTFWLLMNLNMMKSLRNNFIWNQIIDTAFSISVGLSTINRALRVLIPSNTTLLPVKFTVNP